MAGPRAVMLFEHLSARPATAGDAPFLAQLYASTRADLLHLPVPRDVIEAITRHQQQLQADGYAQAFPGAQYLVLEHLAAPIGRVVINVALGELRVVDMSIAPPARRRGHARAVLRALQQRAIDDGSTVALRVRKDNPGARKLYASLGFEVVSADESAEQMRWTPADRTPVQNE
jgi:ribosomal protein S18 acetylase RimI-like enzyme